MENQQIRRVPPLVKAYFILSVAIVLATIIFSMTWRSNNKANQTIEVTGSARKSITADFAILRGSIIGYGTTQKGAFTELENQKPMLLKYLAEKGFTADQVKFSPAFSYAQYEYNNNGQQTGIRGYNYNQTFSIEHNDVQRISDLSLAIASIVEQGVYLEMQTPQFMYTKLADLKIEIQGEAAKDAMVRAEKIMQATGRSLGGLHRADMGVLQIIPKNSADVSDYGMNDVSSIDKEIVAVVHASFEID